MSRKHSWVASRRPWCRNLAKHLPCSRKRIVAGGHGSLGTKAGDYVIAYALPKT
jgi:glucose dehydrogenase